MNSVLIEWIVLDALSINFNVTSPKDENLTGDVSLIPFMLYEIRSAFESLDSIEKVNVPLDFTFHIVLD